MIRVALRPKAAHPSRPQDAAHATPEPAARCLVARLAAVGLAELYGGRATLQRSTLPSLSWPGVGAGLAAHYDANGGLCGGIGAADWSAVACVARTAQGASELSHHLAPAWVAALAAVARLWLGASWLHYLHCAIDDRTGGGQAVAAWL